MSLSKKQTKEIDKINKQISKLIKSKEEVKLGKYANKEIILIGNVISSDDDGEYFTITVPNMDGEYSKNGVYIYNEDDEDEDYNYELITISKSQIMTKELYDSQIGRLL